MKFGWTFVRSPDHHSPSRENWLKGTQPSGNAGPVGGKVPCWVSPQFGTTISTRFTPGAQIPPPKPYASSQTHPGFVYVRPRTCRLALAIPCKQLAGLREGASGSNDTNTSTVVPSGTTVSRVGTQGPNRQVYPVTGPAQCHVIGADSALATPSNRRQVPRIPKVKVLAMGRRPLVAASKASPLLRHLTGAN